MKSAVIFIISVLSFSIIIDMWSMLFLLFVYLVGFALTFTFGGKEKRQIIKVYQRAFIVSSLYAMMSFVFMTVNNYEYLLAYDTINYFLPTTEMYMMEGSYLKTLQAIWGNYDLFNRFQSGYFTYATLFGYLSNFFGANFYFGQQVSVLFLFSFVAVAVYKLFKINNFDDDKAYKYTLIISFVSVLFFYSSQILRDVHVLLLYLLGIYLTFKKDFSLLNLIKIVVVVYLCSTFRIESGLFLLVLIPLYLLLSMRQSKQKVIIVFFSFIIGVGLTLLVASQSSRFTDVVEANQEAYGDDKGDGIIGALQKVPIAGDAASIVYNAVQPIPFWNRFAPSGKNSLGGEVYNILNFPTIFASFFNWIVIVYILFWLCFKNIRLKTKQYLSKPLVYQLWIGLFFLMLQSAVVAQRRLMAYYCIYYILFFIIYNQIDQKSRKYISAVAIGSFILLQLIGVIYLI